jgi:hypothetical protein
MLGSTDGGEAQDAMEGSCQYAVPNHVRMIMLSREESGNSPYLPWSCPNVQTFALDSFFSSDIGELRVRRYCEVQGTYGVRARA